MRIAKILFIITGAALLGGCGDDDNGAVVLNPAYKTAQQIQQERDERNEAAQQKRDKERERRERAEASRARWEAEAKARAAEPKVFLACETEGIWDTLTKARLAGHAAFVNKVHEFVAIGLCIWIPKSAKCVITDTDIWSEINEIYVNDRGPVYAQSNTSCKRRY